MNRKLLFVVGLFAASSAFADDVDLVPNGYVSAAIRAAQSDSAGRVAAAAASTDAGAQPSRLSSAKSRAQIVAETREAARLGLLNVGERGTVDITPEQLRQIEQAGLRAVAIDYAAK